MHADLGPVDATLPDLRCGARWEDIHRVRPRAPLTCPGCTGAVRAKRSPKKLRFFAHDVVTPDCPHHGESLAHHLLKAELAGAAREAGWVCALEVAGHGWRADVLSTHPTQGRPLAWEAQLAAITIEDVEERGRRMREDGVGVCWVSDRSLPWLGQAPSIRVERADDGTLMIIDGLARFVSSWCPKRHKCSHLAAVGPCPGHGHWEPVEPLPLVRLAAAIRDDTTRPLRLRSGVHQAWREQDRVVRWTTAAYAALEAEQVAATEVAEAAQAAALAAYRRGLPPAPPPPDVRRRRLHQAGIAQLVAEEAPRQTGEPAVFDPPQARWAWGVPVSIGGRVRAVICPDPTAVPAVLDRLASVVLYVPADKDVDVLAGHAAPGQRIAVVNGQRRDLQLGGGP
ncbi:hypothetical protein [Embleya sp. NPDC020630]|uniref:competence protein CoiA family protein n=1 Tax=Embleya sp. NPDC020630 TaxID=3363979 RepID=UPI003789D19C